MKQQYKRWGLEWVQKNRLDGINRHLIFEDCEPVFFSSRKEARAFANKRYGYIDSRKDLRIEPHCWRKPRPVRILAIEYKP